MVTIGLADMISPFTARRAPSEQGQSNTDAMESGLSHR